jgi:hypothetical protein
MLAWTDAGISAAPALFRCTRLVTPGVSERHRASWDAVIERQDALAGGTRRER